MKKEDLIAYKKQLLDLSMDDKKERDLYLKGLASGEILGPQVGYATVDKPWLKYVDVEKMYFDYGKKTIYQELIDNNQGKLNKIAIEFFGTKIKFKTLFENIDKVAKSLSAMGVKKGDFVTICSAGVPETVYILYALAKIGAVANFMSPYFDKEKMSDRINDCDSKLIIVMDQFYDDVKEVINKSTIEKTVVLPTLNSSILKYIKPTKVKSKDNIMLFNEFIDKGKYHSIPETIDYEPNLLLALVYSSGTTGASKAIALSHDSFQNSIHSYEACNVNLSDNQKYYQIIPPWYSTGLSTSLHLPLSNGATVFMDPRFDRKIFVSNVIKHKINTTVAPTSLYEGFLDKNNFPKYRSNDLSFFYNAFQGGEPLKKEKKESIEKVFSEHNNNSGIKIGYGQCECGAGIATQTDDIYRSDGSVGIPIPGVICSIVDDNNDELGYNTRGEILVNTTSGMIYYYKNPNGTKEYFFNDEFGNKWSCTGDIGYIDEDGMLFVEGRKCDYTIVNDKKIYNFDIEGVIQQDNDIQGVDVLHRNGNYNGLVVHIIFTPEYLSTATNEEIFNKLCQLQNNIYLKYKDLDYVPTMFKIRTNFPIAASGKRDTILMCNETDDFINVEFSKEKQLILN